MKTVKSFVLPAALAALLAACGTAPATAPSAPPPAAAAPATPPPPALETVLSGSRWAAAELVDPSSFPAPPVPKLIFAGLKEVNGMAGCNTFSANVEVAGDRLALVGPRNTTRKLCLGPPMIVEAKFFMALDNARKARIVNGQLELVSENGTPLLRLVRSE